MKEIGLMKRIAFRIILPLFSIVLLSTFLIPVRTVSILKNPITNSMSKFINSQSEIFINQSQIWHGDFIVNETDTVIIENCNFTVQDGDIYVYGDLKVNNSTIRIHRNTVFKYIWVYGNLTLNESATSEYSIIWCSQGSQAKIYKSNVDSANWINAEVHIFNSTVFFAEGWNGCPAIIQNSEVMYSGVYLRENTNFFIIDSNITVSFDIYIDDGTPSSIQNLKIQPGYFDKWVASDATKKLNVTIHNSLVAQWRACVGSWHKLVNFSLIDSTVSSMYFSAANTPSMSYNLTLETGTIQHQNIYIDRNFNVTILNSTINSWGFSPRGGEYRFVNSNFSMMCWRDSDIDVINSTMSYLATRDFHGNLTISNVTTNSLMLGIETGSMDLVLNEGYQNSLTLINQEQGFNVTVKESKVNHWGIEASGNSTINIFNSTFTAKHPDVLFAGFIVSENSSVSVINSTMLAAESFHPSSSFTLINSTLGTLYVYCDGNFTAINSTIGTIVTDPLNVKLINSTIMSEVYLSIPLDSNYLTSSIEDDCSIPLPSQFQKVSKYLNLASTFNDYLEAQVRIYYNEDELVQLGISENIIQMYFLDEETSQWYPCSIQGVNATYNYVWANVTSFSYFVLGAPTIAKTHRGGGAGRQNAVLV